MTHGDLIPGNVLVSQGRLAGIIDVDGHETNPSAQHTGAENVAVGPLQVSSGFHQPISKPPPDTHWKISPPSCIRWA
jgi:hypothetical protein